jgi:hypothetical protein
LDITIIFLFYSAIGFRGGGGASSAWGSKRAMCLPLLDAGRSHLLIHNELLQDKHQPLFLFHTVLHAAEGKWTNCLGGQDLVLMLVFEEIDQPLLPSPEELKEKTNLLGVL